MDLRRSFFSLTFPVAFFALLINGAAEEPPVSFRREIRPLLADKCFHCHGPDPARRQADLRLDVEASARRTLKGTDTATSELLQRITTEDPELRMPPADSGKEMSPAEAQTLRRWIEQGAPWEQHWSFVPPQRPSVPHVKRDEWVRHELDHFVLKRLETSGLAPSPDADPFTLIRRLYLDLVGLTPPRDAVDAFVESPTDEAYERIVDGLLDSKRYGERMAMVWLDAARYSDTDGFQLDATRTNWPWRDWVIDAYNRNLSFDTFTIEQFAGDLLPEATPEQVLATCFHRNHMTNGEGGRDPEESRVDYVIDRVNTMGTVWLGLTLGCTQCHSHKYDPISHAEYYQLNAFFNSIDEDGRAGGGAKPYLAYRSGHAAEAVEDSRAWLTSRKERLAAIEREETPLFDEWLSVQLASLRRTGGLHSSWTRARTASLESSADSTLIENEGEVTVSGPNRRHDDYVLRLLPVLRRVTGLRLRVLPAVPGGNLSLASDGHIILTNLKISVRTPGERQLREVAIATTLADYAPESGRYGPLRNVLDDDPRTGWTTSGSDPTEERLALFAFAEPVVLTDEQELVVELRHRSLAGHCSMRRFTLEMTDERGSLLENLGPSPLEQLAAVSTDPAAEVTEELRTLLRGEFVVDRASSREARESVRRAEERLAASEKATESLQVMVLRERKERRETHTLLRGVWDKKGETVAAGTPAALSPWSEGVPRDRLGLARWLVSRDHPLTARVAVNRYWQMLFGAGLVRTPEDFGAQGEPPTHPRLLDWLAVEFMESGWNVKHILKQIVLSATYRQGSQCAAELRERDPDNRLLARGNRFRLPSWMLRDAALSASGLLNTRLGGPPVYPYQPPGAWADSTMGRFHYQPSVGGNVYRRSVYSFWRRSVAPTAMFDAPKRRVCQVRVVRTNTPLHALILMNDTTFIEAARVLAQEVLSQSKSTGERVAEVVRRVLARPPRGDELAVLLTQLYDTRSYYDKHPGESLTLLGHGQAPPLDGVDPAELAAYTTVANTVLNLDEAVTRE